MKRGELDVGRAVWSPYSDYAWQSAEVVHGAPGLVCPAYVRIAFVTASAGLRTGRGAWRLPEHLRPRDPTLHGRDKPSRDEARLARAAGDYI